MVSLRNGRFIGILFALNSLSSVSGIAFKSAEQFRRFIWGVEDATFGFPFPWLHLSTGTPGLIGSWDGFEKFLLIGTMFLTYVADIGASCAFCYVLIRFFTNTRFFDFRKKIAATFFLSTLPGLVLVTYFSFAKHIWIHGGSPLMIQLGLTHIPSCDDEPSAACEIAVENAMDAYMKMHHL